MQDYYELLVEKYSNLVLEHDRLKDDHAGLIEATRILKAECENVENLLDQAMRRLRYYLGRH